MIFVYSTHVLAAAAWLGGLPPLFFALKETQGPCGAEEAGNPVAALTHFSVLALPAVGLILASGAGNVGFRVGLSLRALFLADYGYVLCAKAALVAAMLALAWYNRFVALPRLRGPARPARRAGEPLRERWLRARVRPARPRRGGAARRHAAAAIAGRVRQKGNVAAVEFAERED